MTMMRTARAPRRRLERGDREDRRRGRSDDERGSILIVAFIYLTAVSITVLGLANWVSNDLNNVNGFTTSRQLQQASQSTVNFAISNIRYVPLIGSNQTWGQFNYCWGAGGTSSLTIDGNTVNVYCSTVWNPTSAASRTVTIDACSSTFAGAPVTAAACQTSQRVLQVVVVFDDYPPSGAAPVNGSCVLWSWCGEGMTITRWAWL